MSEQQPTTITGNGKFSDKPITRKRKKQKVTICTSHTRYEVIRRVARKLTWKEVSEDDDWMLFWTACSVALQHISVARMNFIAKSFP